MVGQELIVPPTVGPLGRAIDRALFEIWPTAYNARARARGKSRVLALARREIEDVEGRMARRRKERDRDMAERKFDAAGVGPRTDGWYATNSSANAELGSLGSGLDKLRARCRELGRNNEWAAVAPRRIASAVIGRGVTCVLEHDQDSVQKLAQELWESWAETTACHDEGRLNFYGIQRLLWRSVVESGECLARARMRRQSDTDANGDDLPVPMQIQVLEVDHLDSRRDTIGAGSAAGRRVRFGIELDIRNQRRAYWLFPEHPGDPFWVTRSESVPVPAATMAHVHRMERPTQLRGIPWGASVALAVRDLADWKDATLVRFRLSACYVMFVQTDEIEDADSSATSMTGKPIDAIEPGMVKYGRPGETVTWSAPPGLEGMSEFPTFSLRGIAIGYGCPYEVLSGDLSNVNFLSGRMGWNEYALECEGWRDDYLIPQFCQPMFRNWYLQAQFAGLLPEGLRASWTPPPRYMVDPTKEVPMIQARIRNGISTLSEEQRAQGWRPRELIAEQKRDWEQVDAAGLSFDSDGRKPSNAAAAPPDDPNADPNANDLTPAQANAAKKKKDAAQPAAK